MTPLFTSGVKNQNFEAKKSILVYFQRSDMGMDICKGAKVEKKEYFSNVMGDIYSNMWHAWLLEVLAHAKAAEVEKKQNGNGGYLTMVEEDTYPLPSQQSCFSFCLGPLLP